MAGTDERINMLFDAPAIFAVRVIADLAGHRDDVLGLDVVRRQLVHLVRLEHRRRDDAHGRTGDHLHGCFPCSTLAMARLRYHCAFLRSSSGLSLCAFRAMYFTALPSEKPRPHASIASMTSTPVFLW